MAKRRRLVVGLVAAAALVLVAVLVGPYVYLNFIQGEAPSRLGLSPQGSATTVAGAPSADGSWTVGPGSVVGYRVGEVVFGQRGEAVGRTSSITGSAEIGGSTLRAASFTVDMRSVSSDQERRDRQFHGRIMDTATYPTATFRATGPVELGARPGSGVERTVEVPGELTIRGTTKPVNARLTARYDGTVIEVSGSIPIQFAEWNIPNPSFGNAVATEDHGLLELRLQLSRA
jgi:polyisoprenoid-binding protein YceI